MTTISLRLPDDLARWLDQEMAVTASQKPTFESSASRRAAGQSRYVGG